MLRSQLLAQGPQEYQATPLQPASVLEEGHQPQSFRDCFGRHPEQGLPKPFRSRFQLCGSRAIGWGIGWDASIRLRSTSTWNPSTVAPLHLEEMFEVRWFNPSANEHRQKCSMIRRKLSGWLQSILGHGHVASGLGVSKFPLRVRNRQV